MANWVKRSVSTGAKWLLRAAGVDVSDPNRWFSFFGLSNDNLNVTEATVMGLPAFYAGVRNLSKVFASLPVEVYQTTATGSQIDPSHPLRSLIRTRPNDLYSSSTFFQCLLRHALVRGNGYARIIRNGVNRPVSFKLYTPDEVSVSKLNESVYYWTVDGAVSSDDMIHIKDLGTDGIVGRSVIGLLREMLSVPIGAQKYSSSIYKNGAFVGGVLEHPSALKEDAIKRLREQWDSTYGNGAANAGKTAILEGGMKYTRVALTPDESRFLESLKFSNKQIAAVLGVPQSFVGDYEDAHYNNADNADLAFIKYTLIPWIVAFEQEFNYKCFRATETDRFIKFNINGLLRGDIEKRGTFFREMWNIGAFTHNMILSLEDQNTYEGGDRRFVPMNMVPVDKVDQQLQQNNDTQAARGAADRQLLDYLVKNKNGHVNGAEK